MAKKSNGLNAGTKLQKRRKVSRMKSKKLKLVFPSKMKSAYWFFSLIYAMFEVIQGLFFHPYQTVQFLVKKKLFKILIFFPVFCLFMIFYGSFCFSSNKTKISFAHPS